MINEVLSWGLEPDFLTFELRSASVENLQLVKHQLVGWIEAIENNRLVSLSLGDKYCQVLSDEIPDDGLQVHRSGFGQVKVFRKVFKNEYLDSIMYLTDKKKLQELKRRKI